MQPETYDELEFTHYARESLYDTVDDPYFRNKDSFLIYHALQNRLKAIPFGDYLKRYIYLKAGLEGSHTDIPLKDYQMIIRDAFQDNYTPPSFTPGTARLSALTKNWLTQQTVSRKTVFLLGFGLGMDVADVNDFLTKALREPQINAKDPFEVICWYCFRHGYSFPKFEKLWQIYQDTPANSLDMRLIYEDRTMDVRTRMHTVHDDAALMTYLTQLKTVDNVARYSITARKRFLSLYDEARELTAALYTRYGEPCCGEDRPWTREDVSAGDMERMISSAIPVDRYGNLTPGKRSALNEVFMGRRFSRQRIHDILTKDTEVDRFDLITLSFFVWSQKVDEEPNAKRRYIGFVDATNRILEECSLGSLYIANPYECFVLMCILSDDPLGTYADVWEMSYDKEEKATC